LCGNNFGQPLSNVSCVDGALAELFRRCCSMCGRRFGPLNSHCCQLNLLPPGNRIPIAPGTQAICRIARSPRRLKPQFEYTYTRWMLAPARSRKLWRAMSVTAAQKLWRL
jgi:hypothetical protein